MRGSKASAAGLNGFLHKLAGHLGVTVSQKYAHPTPEGLDLHIRRF
jgi:hypothetical protein